MKKNRSRRVYYVLGALLIITIALLVGYRALVIKAILPDLEHVSVGEITFRDDSVRLRLDLTVRNKGYWQVDLLHTELRIYDDTFLLMVYSNDSIQKLKRNGVQVTRLYLTLPISKIVQRIRAHQGEDSTALRLDGRIDFSTFLGDMSTTVKKMYKVRVPVPPEIFFTAVEYRKSDDRGQYDAQCHLLIVNLNPRELEMDSISYDLVAGKFGTIHGTLSHAHIGAMDSTLILAPARFTVRHRLELFARLILDKDIVEYSFVLKGRLLNFTGLDASDVPLTVSSVGTLEIYNEDADDKTKIIRK